MKVNLCKRKLKDGRDSYYLDFYLNGKRQYEFLKLYTKKGDPNNKEIKIRAEARRNKRERELLLGEYDPVDSSKKNSSFKQYLKKYVESKPKWSNYAGAEKHLISFCPGELYFKNINSQWFNEFRNYLEKYSGLKKNTANLYFRKIKEVLIKASTAGYIKKYIIIGVDNPKKEKVERDRLNIKEIDRLIKTPSDRPEIKRAFLFSCFTGLRQSDIRNLKWKDIYDNKININQQKTEKKVSIKVGKTAHNILNTGNVFHLPENNIFNLPSDRTTINRSLARWFKAAEVNKKAFYHLSRHTFAKLILSRGNEIYTLSKMLGHTDVKTTQIYSDIEDEVQEQAIDSLPEFEVSL